MDRRALLSLAVKATPVAVAGTIAVPAVINSLTPNLEERAPEEWMKIAPIRDFPIGKIVEETIKLTDQLASSGLEKKGVYVWRKSENDFVVYSRACTDLGCPVRFDPGSEWFYCPCHGGIFDKEGERRAGPPKRPLWRYAFRIQDSVLEVDLRSVPPMV